MTTYPAKKLKRVEKAKRCIDCGNPSAPPSMLCLECQAENKQ